MDYIGPSSSNTEDIFDLSGVDKALEKFNTYKFNDTHVPRVSEILNACFDKNHLIRWAASIAYEEYDQIKKDATVVGSLAHSQIENYINKEDVSIDHIVVPKYKSMVAQCIENFSNFYMLLNTVNIQINPLYTERSVITPWYGGTIDCIANIVFPNGYGENVIIDYKTSKSIGTEYIMQTYAYMWAVNWLNKNGLSHLPDISGIMIIRVDKNTSGYEYCFLDIAHNFYEFCELEKDLGNMINWYYSQFNLKHILKIAKKTNIMEDSFYGRFES